MSNYSELRAQRIKAIASELKAMRTEVPFSEFFAKKSALFGLSRGTMQEYFDVLKSAGTVEVDRLKNTIKYVGD